MRSSNNGISALEDKSGVGMIIDYSKDYTVVKSMLYLFSIVFSFNLQNCIFQPAMKSEMTSFCRTSLHVDLNEAVKCVDIIPSLHIASLLLEPLHTHAKCLTDED